MDAVPATLEPPTSASTPSPRQHQHPLQLLPLDVLLLIIDLLTPVEFIKFAFAAYPLLQPHNLVPALPPCCLALFVAQIRRARSSPSSASSNNLIPPTSNPTFIISPPPTSTSITVDSGGTATVTPPPSSTPLPRHLPLPAELLIQILGSLPPIDKVSLVLADYADLKDAGIAPAITLATLGALRIAAGNGGRHRR